MKAKKEVEKNKPKKTKEKSKKEEPKEKVEDIKPQEELPEKPKKHKTKLIIVSLLLILILSFGGYFVYQYAKYKEPIEQKWGQTYYLYLKENKDELNKLYNNMENKKIRFVEINNDPIMLIEYEINNNNYTNIYYIKDNNVNVITNDDPSNIKLLYNTEEDTYKYYIHSEKDGKDYFDPVLNQINGNEEETKYEFKKGESYIAGNLSISKYDETFIEPNIKENDCLDYPNNLKGKKLKDLVSYLVKNYKPLNNKITNEVTKEVIKKQEENKKLIESIKNEEKEVIFNRLKGVWLHKEDNSKMVINIKYQDNKKYFIQGYFASEAYYYGSINDINYQDNIYSFTVKNVFNGNLEKVELDVSKIDDNIISVGGNNYRYLASNMDGAYDIIFGN